MNTKHASQTDDLSISVVICTCERPHLLEHCLNSIREGVLAPVELIVVDQSAGDATERLLDDFRNRASFPVRYIHLDCIGHTKARNAGIKASRGSIIAFTDDDCIADSRWLESIAGEFASTNANCVCGSTLPASHAERSKRSLLSTIQHRRRRVISGLCNPATVGKGNNMAFRKAILVALGGFNEQIGVGSSIYAGDDLDIFYRIMQASGMMVQSPDAVVYHAQPDEWSAIVKKKRGYAISVAALLISRARYGDPFAAFLLVGKLSYEFAYLFCGGLLSMNRRLTAIGWHSMVGSLSGMKYLLRPDFCAEISRLTSIALCRRRLRNSLVSQRSPTP